MRSLIVFQLFFAIAATVDSQSIRDQEPSGIHVLYGKEPTHQVNIMWWTKTKTPSAIVYYSLVETENDDIPTESLYCANNMKAKGYLARNSTSGKFIQRVSLSNLEPNRRYCYEITSGSASSHVYSFRTSAYSTLLGLRDEKYLHSSFIVFGSDIAPTLTTQNNQIKAQVHDFDSDLSSLTRSFQDQILQKQIDGFINLPTIHLKEYSKRSTINSQDFLDYYTSVLSNVQLLPALSQMGDAVSRNLFQQMFPLKGTIPFNSYFYSTDVNGVHFLSYSADLFTIKANEFDASAASLLESQLNVIERDLIIANQNRHLVPWVVVIASQSLKCVEFSCETSRNDVYKKRLEALFYKYNVDFVLESSSNVYERSLPVLRTAKKFQTNYDNPEMPVFLSLPKYSVGVNREAQDKWSAFRYQPHIDNTYGLLEVINATYIKWTYIYSNRTVIDQLDLFKDHTGVNKRMQDRHRELLDQTKSNAGSSFRLITFILFLFVATVTVGYVMINKRLRIKRMQKANSNYTNLIESEFDT